MSKKEEKDYSSKKSNIEKDVIFKGNFKFTDQLIVKGTLEGTLEGKEAEVIIEELGVVNGSLEAKKLDNHGQLMGTAILKDYSLYSTGINDCNITTKDIFVEKGAKITGTFKMLKED